MVQINLEALDSVFSGITFVDGMSLERLKTKYWWVFNAKINNAIIGEDDYGLVWYSGTWCCGTWKDGTWYSGVWESGTWEKGIWHSYIIDKINLKHDSLIVLGVNNTESHFKTGTWENGHFHEGTFGLNNDREWSSVTGYLESETVWMNGIFYNGLIYDSAWYKGQFKSGTFTNSFWLYGDFYSGDFNGFEWLNGNWYGGDFNFGTWYDGYFTQLNTDVLSRFGLSNKGKRTSVWKNGIFEKGEFHSGLNLDSKLKPIISLNHNVTHWENGQFKSGDWYGGTFIDGEWFYGNWYEGVWSTFSTDWIYPNSIFQLGDVNYSDWLNTSNLKGNTAEYSELEVLSGYTGFTLSNSLTFSDFDFNLPSGTTVNAFRVKSERKAYYDYYKGGLIDYSIHFDNLGGHSSIDIPSTYPYSYQNSDNKETIYYGDIDTDWITGYTWTSENVDNINLTYQAQSWQEYSGITDITGSLYTMAIKVYHNTCPKWYNGVWYNGIWNNGAFYDGEFRGGVWIKGDFLGGSML